VLDAPVDPARWRTDPFGATVEQAVGGEQQLDLWLATCAAEGQEACPLGPDPARTFDEIVAGLEAAPLTVPAGPSGPGGTLDGVQALLAARVAVFDRRLWPILTAGLAGARDGDGSTLLALATVMSREPDGSPNGMTEANLAVNCLDRAVPTDLAAHQANATAIAAAAPRTGELSGYLMLPCVGWPGGTAAADPAPLTADGVGPVLVVGGREDSQTPYPWAEAMTAELSDARLLTREGVGHGSYRASGACIDTAVDGYLLEGTLPAENTVCPQEPPATTSLAALSGN
jgi:pimeloyl-ACP methyl ester carboxylesterase